MSEDLMTPLQTFRQELANLKDNLTTETSHPLRNLSAKSADPAMSGMYRQMAAVVRSGTQAEVIPGVCLALLGVKMDDIPINPIYKKATSLITWTEILAKIDEFSRSSPKELNAKYGRELTVKE